MLLLGEKSGSSSNILKHPVSCNNNNTTTAPGRENVSYHSINKSSNTTTTMGGGTSTSTTTTTNALNNSSNHHNRPHHPSSSSQHHHHLSSLTISRHVSASHINVSSNNTTTSNTTTNNNNNSSTSSLNFLKKKKKKYSDEEEVTTTTGRWTKEEHEQFEAGLKKFKDRQWKNIASMIPTRTVVQVRTHAQKHFQKMERNEKKRKLSMGSTNDTITSEKQLNEKKLSTRSQTSSLKNNSYHHRYRKKKEEEETIDVEVEPFPVMASLRPTTAAANSFDSHSSSINNLNIIDRRKGGLLLSKGLNTFNSMMMMHPQMGVVDEENIEPHHHNMLQHHRLSNNLISPAHDSYVGGEDIHIDGESSAFLSLPPIMKHHDDVSTSIDADETFEFFSTNGIESVLQSTTSTTKTECSNNDTDDTGSVKSLSSSSKEVVQSELLDFDFNYASAESYCSDEQERTEDCVDTVENAVVLDDPKLFVSNFFSQNK